MLKIAIVGCGKIADVHASQIIRIKGCEIVAVCDTEELMAKQLHERYPVKSYYRSLDEMLDQARPDVVHITTPPRSHLDLGLKCLEAGCHIYVEKPFTLDTAEAELLLEGSRKVNRKVTVGHDAQFSEVARRLRKLVRDGYLGGMPTHIESVWCYNFGDATYAKALLGDRHHWVRTLPGGLLHNIISHGVSKISEFMTGENPHVVAQGFTSPFLRHLGEDRIIDELRTMIHDKNGTTAYFTFSSQIQPSLHQFSIFGPANGIVIDEDKQTLITLRGGSYKSYLENFIPPIMSANQYLSNFRRNLRLFLSWDFHMSSGMKYLIESFYHSITDDEDPPIPYGEILQTSKIMDAIFDQTRTR